jgi:lysophospholipase L1-like esterase
MKKYFLIISLVFNLIFVAFSGYIIAKKGGIPFVKSTLLNAFAHYGSGQKPDWYYKVNPFWKAEKEMFEALPNEPGEIIFFGNSLTAGCEWAELFNNPKVRNRGIGGDTADGLLERVNEVTVSKPSKVFIEVGINDLYMKFLISDIIKNYSSILENIKMNSAETQIYIQSLLPLYNHTAITTDSIIVFNNELKRIAEKYNATYLNLFDSFADEKGDMKKELSFDGVHLTSQGYLLWKRLTEEYVNGPGIVEK